MSVPFERRSARSSSTKGGRGCRSSTSATALGLVPSREPERPPPAAPLRPGGAVHCLCVESNHHLTAVPGSARILRDRIRTHTQSLIPPSRRSPPAKWHVENPFLDAAVRIRAQRRDEDIEETSLHFECGAIFRHPFGKEISHRLITARATCMGRSAFEEVRETAALCSILTQPVALVNRR